MRSSPAIPASVNLFKLIAAALDMQRGRGNGARKVVLSEPGNFPTDLYMIEGLERQGLAERRLASRDAILSALDDDVALLLLTHAHYKTGELFDMGELTRAAHEAGALVLWDLSHSGGALPVRSQPLCCRQGGRRFRGGLRVQILQWRAGAPAYAFVAERHLAALRQPLTGWFGHAEPFAFSDDYTAARGIEQLQCGTPPVLGLAALEMGVDLIAEMGVARLYGKSQCLLWRNSSANTATPRVSARFAQT